MIESTRPIMSELAWISRVLTLIHPLPTLQIGIAPHAPFEHGDGVHRFLEPVVQRFRNSIATGFDLDLDGDLFPVEDSDSGHDLGSHERRSRLDFRQNRIYGTSPPAKSVSATISRGTEVTFSVPRKSQATPAWTPCKARRPRVLPAMWLALAGLFTGSDTPFLTWSEPLPQNVVMDVYEEIVRLRREGRSGAVATIVRRIGSTPRKDHAKMLVRQDGSFVGTVGGGCVEAEVWRHANQVMESGRATLVKYKLTQEDTENEGLVCGGTVEIFIEPVIPEPTLILMGAGHLGQAIAEAADKVDFQVVVLDDREAFANRQRFPRAREVIVDSFRTGLSQTSVTVNTFILIITRGHSHDHAALEKAIQTEARYVGLVGSRRKIQLIVDNLLQQGYPPDLFENLYAPIGLAIGSETPEEIAISVVGELIAIRKGVHERNRKQLFVRKILERARTKQAPAQVGAG